MILFVSGRCDIPAFYSTWFFNRLQEGFVDVRNPFNPHQISRIYLNEQNIDGILFCTKNPIPMMNRLEEVPFLYQFQITLTPYHEDIEEHVASKKEIVNAVREMSLRLGKDRVIVRYDPILLTPKYTVEYHRRAFEKLCSQLEGWMSERHWAVSLSAMLYIYKHVQRILIFPPIIFTRDSVWIVKSLRDWYSIPWIIFRERVCDLSVAACRRLISVIITVVRTAVGTAMPIIMKNRLRKE